MPGARPSSGCLRCPYEASPSDPWCCWGHVSPTSLLWVCLPERHPAVKVVPNLSSLPCPAVDSPHCLSSLSCTGLFKRLPTAKITCQILGHFCPGRASVCFSVLSRCPRVPPEAGCPAGDLHPPSGSGAFADIWGRTSQDRF